MKIINRLSQLSIDLGVLALLGCFGWFLIGYFSQYEYLVTGYQDWAYHAFRIQSFLEHGFVSWDHVWSNGINYWWGYQYWIHVLTALVSQFFSLSVTKSMIVVTITGYLGYRGLLYLILRKLNFNRLAAFMAVLVSFTLAPEWGTMKDFSLYFAALFSPWIYVAFQKSLKSTSGMWQLTTLAGISWLMHPVMGYTTTGLWIWAMIFKRPKVTLRHFLTLLPILIVTSLGFWLPQLNFGYKFTSPFLGSLQFLKLTAPLPYLNLSLSYVILLALSWVFVIARVGKANRANKALLLYITIALLLLKLGLNGYLPRFLGQLQYGRISIILGLWLPFIFAEVIQGFLGALKGRMGLTFASVSIALLLSEAIMLASQYQSGVAKALPDNPVAGYFQNKTITGSVFYSNVSEASFMTHGQVRMVTSYNQHAELHPMSQRLLKLIEANVVYSGMSETRMKLIENYTRVLGVEYLVLPDLNPLWLDLITVRSDQQPVFIKEAVIEASGGTYVIIKRNEPIAYAYISKRVLSSNLFGQELPKPNLRSDSYAKWDELVNWLGEKISTNQLIPVTTDLSQQQKIKLILPRPLANDEVLLINLSFHRGFSLAEPNSKLLATLIKTMWLETSTTSTEITLTHDWPDWYWPIQKISWIASIIMISIIASYTLLIRAGQFLNQIRPTSKITQGVKHV